MVQIRNMLDAVLPPASNACAEANPSTELAPELLELSFHM